MKILLVNYEYPPLGGGGGVIARDIAEELATRHDVTVLTSGFKDLPTVEKKNGVEIHRVPVLMRKELPTASMPSMLSFWPLGVRYGKKLLKQKQFDVVNSHFVVPSATVGTRLAEIAGIPHALSIHGGDIFDPSKKMSPHRHWALRTLVRRMLHKADRIIGPSHDIMNNAKKWYDPNLTFEHIPLGIKPTPDLPCSRADFGIGEDRFVMITTGRLVPRKNINVLIEALKKMNDPRDLAIVLGDGPMKEEWLALAKQLGVEDRIQFRGFVSQEDKYKLKKLADVYASPATHEGFGLVFVEAMDRGLPIVSFNRGGHVDYLIDGKTGGVAPLNDVDAFVDRLVKLKSDAGFRQRCSDYNRETVKNYYISVCAGRYEKLFEKLIAQKKAA